MTKIAAMALVAAVWVVGPAAQTLDLPVEFSAAAIVNNNVASGAGNVIIRIDRWSTEAQRNMLVETLLEKGSSAALEALRDLRPVGSIRTPDSLAYDLHYAQHTPAEDGGQRIVLATDRPIGFWEAWYQPRTVEYPFTVIQMQIDRDGEGKGTMSYATKVLAHDNIIELENYSTSPVMLNNIESRQVR